MQAGSITRPIGCPSSTYRVQFYRGVTFGSARDIVKYLARLKPGAFYSSPFFRARPGSSHGYDVVDHHLVHPELGTEEEFRTLMADLQAAGLRHLVDFVPNHMGVDPAANPYWRDVLENGSCSAYAHYFDIDWDPVKVDLKGKVLLPLLGDQYGRVLERGELQLAFADGALVLRYWEAELPINPRRAPLVLRHDLERLTGELGEDHPHVREFLSILTGLHNLPAYTESDPERIAERRREKEVLRERLQRLASESPRVLEHIEGAVRHANGDPARPESFDLLHELLEVQAYRLAYWRTAAHEVNYRRFFDVNELGGLRVEDPAVFESTHALLGRLIAEGVVTGVRIDHADGLYDPTTYFAHLQGLAASRADDTRAETLDRRRPLWVVVEKILSDRERLSPDWAVHGTTGYTFLNAVNGLFVRRDQAKVLTRAYVKFTGRSQSFREVAYHSKRLIMNTSMASELNVLAHELDRMTEANRHSRDFTLNSLREVLREVVACFPVYRTYVNPGGWTVDDAAVVDEALAHARRRNPAMEASIFDFLRAVLLPQLARRSDEPGDPFATTDEATYGRRLAFAMRFQQYTGPVQAKGIEDTAFYRYNVLVSLNEVGGEPDRWGCTAAEFHDQNEVRLRDWPLEMITTATHDTKLGEDVRTRIDVLSELPNEWRKALSTWVRATADCRLRVDDEWAPDRNDEYRFFQILVGCWPPGFTGATTPPGTFVERIREYMHKAIKEAKVHTSWIRPNQPYDDAVARYVDRVLYGLGHGRFFTSFLPFARRIAALGMVNSLAQLALKMASPGVVDVYQGNELWDLSLVDPDNRRPVDFGHRQALLDEIEPLVERLVAHEAGEEDTARVAHLTEHWDDGRIKMLITSVGLRLRRADPDLFLCGEYVRLAPDVPLAADVVAFARVLGPRTIVAVVPRHIAALAGSDARWPRGTDWKTSRVLLPAAVPGQDFVNVITGERLRRTTARGESWIFVGEALRVAPVALLVADGGPGAP